MDYELLYKLVQQNQNKNISDVANDALSSVKAVKGQDILSGVLGMYLKSKLPDSLSVNENSISYSPTQGSTYGIKLSGGSPQLNASWRF